LLDGAVAQPQAVRLPREGYAVEVKGKGSHALLVRFTVPQAGVGDDRDLRFAVPELARSRLTLDVPAGAGYLHLGEARGAQRVTGDDRGLRLEADLGAVSTVRARWRRDGHQPRPASVLVKEAYYWDLQASSARLLAVLQYAVQKGWDTSFELELPRELEVLGVEAGSLPGGSAAPRLKEWVLREEGGARRLRIEFQSPVTGGVQVTLELVPRQPFGATANLPFPTPLEAQGGRAFLAYRTDGVTASVAAHRGITGIDRAALAEGFAENLGQPWRQARQEELAPPAQAFWRVRGGMLTLALTPPVPPLRCQFDVSWQLTPRQATVRAVARLAAADGGLSFVELEVAAGRTPSARIGRPGRSSCCTSRATSKTRGLPETTLRRSV
jgi:hypothetical protein